jgi:hypothetical protein
VAAPTYHGWAVERPVATPKLESGLKLSATLEIREDQRLYAHAGVRK